MSFPPSVLTILISTEFNVIAALPFRRAAVALDSRYRIVPNTLAFNNMSSKQDKSGFQQVMSPNNQASSKEETRSGKGKPSPASSNKGGRGHGRSSARSPVKPIDFDAKNYDNPEFKITMLFPGNAKFTLACTVKKIAAKSFMVGVNHASAHAAAKQAIYEILYKTLDNVFPMNDHVKEGLDTLVEKHHSPKSIGADTFRFAHESQPTFCPQVPADDTLHFSRGCECHCAKAHQGHGDSLRLSSQIHGYYLGFD